MNNKQRHNLSIAKKRKKSFTPVVYGTQTMPNWNAPIPGELRFYNTPMPGYNEAIKNTEQKLSNFLAISII